VETGVQGLVFFWEAGQGQGRLCRDLGHKNFSLECCLFCWYRVRCF